MTVMALNVIGLASPRLLILEMRTGLWVWTGAVAVTLVCHPCPSLGGVELHSSGPGLHIPGCCQVSKIGRPPETQHCPLQFLPPSIWLPLPPDSSPLPPPCFSLDTLHSCCHAALSQSQFIPSSCPFRDMHSPGRRGQAATANSRLQRTLLQTSAGVFWLLVSLNVYWLFPQYAGGWFRYLQITASYDNHSFSLWIIWLIVSSL